MSPEATVLPCDELPDPRTPGTQRRGISLPAARCLVTGELATGVVLAGDEEAPAEPAFLRGRRRLAAANVVGRQATGSGAELLGRFEPDRQLRKRPAALRPRARIFRGHKAAGRTCRYPPQLGTGRWGVGNGALFSCRRILVASRRPPYTPTRGRPRPPTTANHFCLASTGGWFTNPAAGGSSWFRP